ncbi:MAG: DUF2079 domain-containing protein [Nostocaceae cyanobacterium]|nr:DUF2079 domain-containing protein [Nostocaceae cyanobacterium]
MLVKQKINPLASMIGVSAVILFICSSLRHALFKSSAYDLGIFDQAVYLISQGETPFSTIRGLHILGDHAAWIFYPLAVLYKIHPDVHWLFAVQALSLALAALPIWGLALQAGLSQAQAITTVLVYLLYPLVFNVNLFDFHPEVIAVPALLAAVWCARSGRTGWFGLSIILVLGCKAVLSLTVVAMGVWLLFCEKKRWCGAFAIFAGIAWFLIASQGIIPLFSGEQPAGVTLYSYLGNSVSEIAKNLLLKPGLILGKIFSLDTLEYLALLLAPVIWGLVPQRLLPLISAIPTLMLNILSNADLQRNLVHHYSLAVLPFLMLVVISSLAANQVWLPKKRAIILWSLVGFLALAKYGYFWSLYIDYLDTWQATRAALSQVQTTGSVYTTAEISPHLTHRKLIKFTDANSPPKNLTEFDYVLLNLRHPGWLSNPDFARSLVNQLQVDKNYSLIYKHDDVYLFSK